MAPVALQVVGSLALLLGAAEARASYGPPLAIGDLFSELPRNVAFGAAPALVTGGPSGVGGGARIEASLTGYGLSLSAGARVSGHTAGTAIQLGGEVTFFGLIGVGGSYHFLPGMEGRPSLDIIGQVPLPIGIWAHRPEKNLSANAAVQRLYLLPYLRGAIISRQETTLELGVLVKFGVYPLKLH